MPDLDYLTDVEPFLDSGMTPSQIAAHLANRTANPIPCDATKTLLEEYGLVIEHFDGDRRFTGTLIDRYDAMPDNEIKQLLGWFITHVFGRGQHIHSNTNPRAVQLATVIAGLPPAMQAVGAKLIELGGGQPMAGTTEQDVIDCKSNMLRQLEWETADVLHIADVAYQNYVLPIVLVTNDLTQGGPPTREQIAAAFDAAATSIRAL